MSISKFVIKKLTGMEAWILKHRAIIAFVGVFLRNLIGKV